MSNTTIKTLKTAKVGDKVSMLTFTGMNLGQFEIAKAGKTKLAITKKNGDVAEFSRETGIQTNANNPKFANRIVDAIPETEKKAAAPAKKAAPTKKATKKAEPEVEAEEVETEETEVEAEVKVEKKATKPAAKKAPAKKAPAKKVEKVEIPEDADDFSDEDLDDDFEEFDEE